MRTSLHFQDAQMKRTDLAQRPDKEPVVLSKIPSRRFSGGRVVDIEIIVLVYGECSVVEVKRHSTQV